MFYLELFLMAIWIIVSSTLGLFVAITRWGNPSNNAIYGRMYSFILVIVGFKIQVEGKENLTAHQPCIFIANHQSGFDVPVIGRFFPFKTLIIGKKEIIWIPFFGPIFAAGGNLFIDRSNKRKAIEGLAKISRAVHERGASILVFPEGTRNRAMKGILPFKKGAFHMAIQTQVPIVPIVVQEFHTMMNFKERWFKRGSTVKAKVLGPIPTKGLTMDGKDVDVLSALCRQKMLDALKEISG